MTNQQNTKSLSHSEVASFCSQMAMILRAGISSLEGIAIMKEEATLPEDQKILTTIYDSLLETGLLTDALEASGVFPAYFLQMCHIGEQTGQLDKVMTSLSAFYEREAGIAASMRSAVTYPMVMLTMMLIVISVLLSRVLPIFQQVFNQLGAEMSWASRRLMALGNVLNRYGIVFILVILVLAVLVLYLTRSQKGQAYLITVSDRLPFSRKFSDLTASCRFAGGMSLLLSSGFSPEESINMAGKLSDGPRFQQKLKECLEKLESGEPLSDALIKSGIFTGIYGRMVLVAQKTGTLDEVMQDIAGRYEEELDGRLAGAMAVLEPTLVAILSVITGIILLSVMLPLLGILSGM
ncbi:type II secretion system F family protein [Roseburia hominis]